ncbi:MAG: roadblock/LC7 domain-containing protein [Actinomycetota bacterium]
MTAADELQSLLDRFATTTMGVEDVLAVSGDGIRLASSAGLPDAMADQFGAIATGLTGLALGAARCFAEDNVQRIVIEMDRTYLLMANLAHGAVLGVLARKNADMGLIAYEMTLLADSAGRVLSPTVIARLENALAS